MPHMGVKLQDCMVTLEPSHFTIVGVVRGFWEFDCISDIASRNMEW